LAIGDDPYDPDHGCPVDFDKSFYKARPINQWPQRPSDYRAVMNEYRTAALDFAKRFLRIIALALDLAEDHFNYMTQFPMAGMRALHYPPQEVSNDVGIGEPASHEVVVLSLIEIQGHTMIIPGSPLCGRSLQLLHSRF
jgi:isopenicillin N synthase-like dioxygenase